MTPAACLFEALFKSVGSAAVRVCGGICVCPTKAVKQQLHPQYQKLLCVAATTCVTLPNVKLLCAASCVIRNCNL
jgi:hypothetical protein